jgi:hypothetical protein
VEQASEEKVVIQKVDSQPSDDLNKIAVDVQTKVEINSPS